MFSTARCHLFCRHLRSTALPWRKMNKRGRKVWLSLGDLLLAPARCLVEAENAARDESRCCGKRAEPRSSTGTAQQTDSPRGKTRRSRKGHRSGPHHGPREQQSTGETLSIGSSREAAGKGLGRLCRAGKHSQDGAAGAWPRQELHNGLFGHD